MLGKLYLMPLGIRRKVNTESGKIFIVVNGGINTYFGPCISPVCPKDYVLGLGMSGHVQYLSHSFLQFLCIDLKANFEFVI